MVIVMKKLKRAGAFTLIELLVVLAIVALLLSIATPRYFQSIDAAKEAVLLENLRITRDTIDKFYGDTGRYPEGLEELVEKKYLREIPFDPIMESRTSWQLMAPENTSLGKLFNIKSGAPGKNRQGVPYADL